MPSKSISHTRKWHGKGEASRSFQAVLTEHPTWSWCSGASRRLVLHPPCRTLYLWFTTLYCTLKNSFAASKSTAQESDKIGCYALVITKPKISMTSQNSPSQSQRGPWVWPFPLSSISKILGVPILWLHHLRRQLPQCQGQGEKRTRGSLGSFILQLGSDTCHFYSVNWLDWPRGLAQPQGRLGRMGNPWTFG